MLSLCLIVKPTKKEAKLLDRCLSGVAGYVDEICITQAGSKPIKEVSDVIKKYQGKESFFKWNYNFADARNYNFEQATGDYIFWLDADDVVENPELIPALVKKMEKEKIDATVMYYLYDFDEFGKCTVKQLKTRIVKNGCVRWIGEIHEDFEPTRALDSQMTNEIHIIHKTDNERIQASSERNLEIAQKNAEKYPDDPRSYWLMANALAMKGDNKEAINWYEKFVQTSNSAEEKYIAYLNLGSLTNDISYLFEALKLKPRYPNAYHKIGEMLMEDGKYKQAIDMFITGLQMPIPDTSIVVFNPRDYDFNPMMLLARCYENIDEPVKALEVLKRCIKIYPNDIKLKKAKQVLEIQEKLVKEIDEVIEKIQSFKDKNDLRNYLNSLDAKIQSHPKIVAIRNQIFVTTKSSGKDVVYYCGYTDKVWTPDTAETEGVGGSEEAVIHLSKRWQELGYNVTVYNNCGIEEKEFDGVKYKPYWMFNPKDKTDLLIIWRQAKLLDFDLNADRIYVDLHDVVPAGEFTPERLEKLDKVFVKTQAHLDLFKEIDTSKFVVVPNGIDPKDFKTKSLKQCPYCKNQDIEKHKNETCIDAGGSKDSKYNYSTCHLCNARFDYKIQRNPYLILNTSSPDRHLDATLDIFEKLIKEQPDKPWRLAWYYGWDNFLKWHSDNKEMMEYYDVQNARFQRLVKQGKAEGGVMISHKEIAQKYLEAGVFLYPTQFYEIHCISAVKAQLAGCYPITSNFAALNETVQFGVKVKTKGEKWEKENTFGDTNTDKYVKAIIETTNEDKQAEIAGEAEWAEETYNWDNIAKEWVS
jgi:glycosyltransferase involved in cell wall biosynthesis